MKVNFLNKFFLISTLIAVQNTTAQSDTSLIKSHLEQLTKTKGYRHFMNVELLNKTADFIASEFKKYADTTYFQEYQVNGITYKNVVCLFESTLINSFGTSNSELVVIGAHYDACGMQEGADDNASGVVGLMEIARQLKGKQFSHPIELVAYTLEEPPYFRTENMGSYVHAKSLADSKKPVYGMVSLEMIGYFKDEKKSQKYPIGLMRLFYGSKGNYITLVNKFGKGKFSRKFTKIFKQAKIIRSKKFNGPKILLGVDFSDHLNYWRFNISALMLTDTAFYRNKNYHQNTDTMETLDLGRMAKVIDSTLETLCELR
jgi:Zn-dependent M28 family amino/carboxypeptidase